jgi:CRISPR-associated exonuclease Cas4
MNANEQTQEIFAHEASSVAAASVPIRWMRPSESDPDKLVSEAEGVENLDEVVADVPLVQGGAMRGSILHRLMEEILTGELADRGSEIAARAKDLLSQLSESPETSRVDPDELAATVLRTLALPDVSERRQQLVPELPAHSSPGPDVLLSGRADAVALNRGVAEVVFDWKSDTAPTNADRAAHRSQLRSYIGALRAKRGAVVYMTLGQVEWVEKLVPASDS